MAPPIVVTSGRAQGDTVAQRQPLGAAVLPLPDDVEALAVGGDGDRRARRRLGEGPDRPLVRDAVGAMVPLVVEQLREEAEILVVAEDLGAAERLPADRRVPLVQQ